MTVFITLTIAGTDTGPFNLFSDIDGFTSAFETGVDKATLTSGYSCSLVPDFTNIIRIISTSELCPGYIDLEVMTTTTTTTLPVTTTTTTSGVVTTTTTGTVI